MAKLVSFMYLLRYLMQTVPITGRMEKRKAFTSAVIQPTIPWWFSL